MAVHEDGTTPIDVVDDPSSEAEAIEASPVDETQGSGGATGVQQVPSSDADTNWEMPVDERARVVCLGLSVAQILLGAIVCMTSWAAWRYTAVVGIAAIIAGSIGLPHYKDQRALQHAACCCHATLYLRYQTNVQVSLGSAAFAAAAVSVAAAASDSSDDRGTAIASVLSSFILSLSSFAIAVYVGRFQRTVDWFHREIF